MQPSPDNAPEPQPSNTSLRVALIYAAFGILWIVLSDRLVATIAPDMARLTYYQTIKGWLYIVVTALLIYGVVRRSFLAAQQSHQLLSRSEHRYRAMVETSLDGIALTNPDGNVVFANARLAEMTGRPIGALIGCPLGSLLHDENGRPLSEMPSGQPGDVARRHDVRPQRLDGQERWAIASLCPLFDHSSLPLGTLVMLTDITERRRLTDELHQSQKMEAVGQLAGGVAHDFNNLLMAIFGYTDLASETLTPDHPARKSLEGVMIAAEQAAGVSRALLTFSRKSPAHKQAVDLNESVRKSVKLLQRLLPASIRVETELAGDTPLLLHADATQLQQIIMNLAINARDAMPQGGTVRIVTRMVDCTAVTASLKPYPPASRDCVQLVVSDTGIGMAPDVIEHIFEPFYTTKPKGVGTGLGLAIIHGIVKDHAGTIEVESQPDRGTTFTVTMAALEQVTAAPSVTAVAGARGGGELILLAEDNAQIRELTTHILTSRGYSVLPAADGQELLEQFEKHRDRIRIIVTDSDMPRRGGLDCLREIRRQGWRVPAIVATATVELDLNRDVDPHTTLLRKPYPMRELVNLIAERLAATPQQP